MKKIIDENNIKAAVFYENLFPDFILIQPTGEHEKNSIEEEYDLIKKESKLNFAFVVFEIKDWNFELSPWNAKQAFGDEEFGNGGEKTLENVKNILIPQLGNFFESNAKYILGGYSLAGLFSLWAGYKTDIFFAIAACSPSVWIDGWIEFAEKNPIKTENIYLSLGTKEHKTRNPIMKTVKDKIILQEKLLENKNVFLEFNSGNHFQDTVIRKAKGFLWCLNNK